MIRQTAVLGALFVLLGLRIANAEVERPMPIISNPTLQTARLGGVDVPSAEVLKKMHASQYILRAAEGKLTKVPAEKVLLPHDPEANPQAIKIAQAPDGTVYVNLASILCKSTDGGSSWSATVKGAGGGGDIAVRADGALVCTTSEGEYPHARAVFTVSRDGGKMWEKISEIENPKGDPPHSGGGTFIRRLPGDVLLAGIGHPNHVFESVDGKLVLRAGSGALWAYRSIDGGKTWAKPALIHDWASEGGVDVTASGKLIAALRYQRTTMPGDPPDLEKQTGSVSPGWAYKHVFLADSVDDGRSWKNFRQLTTVFGQTRGFPAALSDGTVVVIHDTRYGPGKPGSRAMISRDEGQTWQDEVYYLDYTTFTGSYNGSVVLDGDLILSVVGSSQAGNSWEAVIDNTDFYAIRWKPVRYDDQLDP